MTYEPQTQARDYQLEGLEKMRGRSAFALLMKMRTGKTKVALDDFGRLEKAGQVRDLMVMAPKGVYRTWVGEMEKHLSKDLLARLSVEVYDSAKKDVPEEFLTKVNGPRVLLVNIEAIQRPGRARKLCERFVPGGKCMLVVDESTVIKNREASRTKYMVQKLGPMARCRRILSGLPTPRSPLDIYYQFEFLQPGLLGYHNWWDFRANHAIIKKMLFGGRTIDLVVGYRNVEELQKRVEPHSFRVDFRPNFPPTYTIRDVEMTEEQKKLYAEIKHFASAKLEDEAHVSAPMVITQILRLHQVLCGHVVDEEGKLHVVPDNKIAELMELLDEYTGKAIIWCSYDHDVRKVCQALANEYDDSCVLRDGNGIPILAPNGKERRRDPQWPNPVVARFWGGNERTREEEEKRFKTDPNCRFMVATPDSGGMGRTWDVADLVIYHSCKNDLEHRDQSEMRAQGSDKKKPVDYVDLVCRGTVEEKILSALREKIDLAATITGDEWREWII